MSWFHPIKVVQEGIDRANIVKNISDEDKFSLPYFVLLILSIVIATMGLIINNAAIIIGSMILSPFLWPILGVALGTVLVNKNLILRSTLLLITSILITIAISALIASLAPFYEIQSEIASRSNPTLFDLIIALAAGFAAPLILTWSKFSSSAAGVAVAASLLPPATTIGIGLALQDMEIAYGSFLLFLTNLASIIFAGIIIFTAVGFYRRSDEDQAKSVGYGLGITFLVIMLLAGQLLVSLRQILADDQTKLQINAILDKELKTISSDIEIDTIGVKRSVENDNFISIESVVKTPPNLTLNINQKNNIVHTLEEALEKKIDLELRFIPAFTFVSLPSPEEQAEEDTRKKIQESIVEDILEISDEIQVDEISIGSAPEQSEDAVRHIELLLKIPNGITISTNQKEKLAATISDQIQEPIRLDVRTIQFAKIEKEQQPDEPTLNVERISQALKTYIQENRRGSQIALNNVDVSFDETGDFYLVDLSIEAPESVNVDFEYRELLKEIILDAAPTLREDDIELELKVFNYISPDEEDAIEVEVSPVE